MQSEYDAASQRGCLRLEYERWGKLSIQYRTLKTIELGRHNILRLRVMISPALQPCGIANTVNDIKLITDGILYFFLKGLFPSSPAHIPRRLKTSKLAVLMNNWFLGQFSTRIDDFLLLYHRKSRILVWIFSITSNNLAFSCWQLYGGLMRRPPSVAQATNRLCTAFISSNNGPSTLLWLATDR